MCGPSRSANPPRGAACNNRLPSYRTNDQRLAPQTDSLRPGRTMSLPDAKSSPAQTSRPLRRRWFKQYSLRMMLVAMFLAGVGFGWRAMREAGLERQAAIAQLRQAGWAIELNSEGPWTDDTEHWYVRKGSDWQRKLLGDAFFDRAFGAAVHVGFDDQSKLDGLAALTDLRKLHLSGPGVTDAAMSQLHLMRNLRDLRLEGSRVTAKGMAHVARRRQLRSLRLFGTQVSGTGLVRLREALPRCIVEK